MGLIGLITSSPVGRYRDSASVSSRGTLQQRHSTILVCSTERAILGQYEGLISVKCHTFPIFGKERKREMNLASLEEGQSFRARPGKERLPGNCAGTLRARFQMAA
jgi:hypothetical protein